MQLVIAKICSEMEYFFQSQFLEIEERGTKANGIQIHHLLWLFI